MPVFLLFCLRNQHKVEGLVSIMYAILLQWPSTPRVLTAYTHVGCIEEEIGELRLLQVEAVTLFLLIAVVEFLGIEVESAGIEWSAALHLQAQAGSIGLLPPADIALGTTLLWTDVWEVLVVGFIIVDGDAHAVLAVGVVLNRTATVVGALLHAVWHLQQHTEAEHIAHLGTFCCLEVFCYLHCTCIGEYEVSDVHLTLNLRHIE